MSVSAFRCNSPELCEQVFNRFKALCCKFEKENDYDFNTLYYAGYKIGSIYIGKFYMPYRIMLCYCPLYYGTVIKEYEDFSIKIETLRGSEDWSKINFEDFGQKFLPALKKAINDGRKLEAFVNDYLQTDN